MIDLPSLAGCSRMEYVAATKTPLRQLAAAHRRPPTRSPTSGIARIDLSGATPIVTDTLLGQLARHAAAQLLVGRAGLGHSGLDGDVRRVRLHHQRADRARRDLVARSGGRAATMSIQGGAFNLGRAALSWRPRPRCSCPTPTRPIRWCTCWISAARAPVDIDANPSQHLPPREVAWY